MSCIAGISLFKEMAKTPIIGIISLSPLVLTYKNNKININIAKATTSIR